MSFGFHVQHLASVNPRLSARIFLPAHFWIGENAVYPFGLSEDRTNSRQFHANDPSTRKEILARACFQTGGNLSNRQVLTSAEPTLSQTETVKISGDY